ncbi:MAG: hypothetical protein GTN93_21020 [Anaerolineae bacterium]|nr:hypothetical protein [Anaerolineae bacterium]
MAVLTTLALTLLACSGDSDDSGPIGEDEAKETAEEFLLTSLQLFTGEAAPTDFIDLFAPECREQVDESEIALALALIQAFAPQFEGLVAEAVDVGRVTVEHIPEGTLVNLANPDSVRVVIDGETSSMNQLFESLGLEQESSEVGELLLVRSEGQVLLGDCSDLTDYGGVE